MLRDEKLFRFFRLFSLTLTAIILFIEFVETIIYYEIYSFWKQIILCLIFINAIILLISPKNNTNFMILHGIKNLIFMICLIEFIFEIELNKWEKIHETDILNLFILEFVYNVISLFGIMNLVCCEYHHRESILSFCERAEEDEYKSLSESAIRFTE